MGLPRGSLFEFSNQKFYDNKLDILKSTPKHTNENQITVIHVDGHRNNNGVNEKEALAVLKQLNKLIIQFKKESKKPTIGIISMFNNQVVFINKRLKEMYDISTIRTFNLLCGTPYQFQGSERDIILLSFVICNQTHHSAIRYTNKPEVLNVAITRAKSKQYIFKSFHNQSIKSESLVTEYLSFIDNFSYSKLINSNTDDFQKQIIHELKRLKYDDIITGYPVAGTVLDILIHYKGKDYFIDLIGYPGDFKDAVPLEKYETLSRVGIHSYPIHYSAWKTDKKSVIQKLIEFLG